MKTKDTVRDLDDIQLPYLSNIFNLKERYNFEVISSYLLMIKNL